MEYVTVTKEKYAALLAVVEAAQEFIDGNYWRRTLPNPHTEKVAALSAALARLEEEQ
jgi:hypothetical protein